MNINIRRCSFHSCLQGTVGTAQPVPFVVQLCEINVHVLFDIRFVVLFVVRRNVPVCTQPYSLLFKFVCAKIGGEAKAKLLARTHVNSWEQAKAVFE